MYVVKRENSENVGFMSSFELWKHLYLDLDLLWEKQKKSKTNLKNKDEKI